MDVEATSDCSLNSTTNRKSKSIYAEIHQKTAHLNELYDALLAAKTQLKDLEEKQKLEKEKLKHDLDEITKQIELSELIIETYIPEEQCRQIESFAKWNDEISDWQLKYVASTGNNSQKHLENRKQRSRPKSYKSSASGNNDSSLYLSYTARSLDLTRPRTYKIDNRGDETFRIE